MTLEERRRQLGQELRPHIANLLDSPFTRDLEAGRLNPHQLWTIFSQYRHYCQEFTGFLEALLKRTDSAIAQKPLLENLWEERGSGDDKKSHVVMLENFVGAWGEALGMTAVEARSLAPARPPIQSFVTDIRKYLVEAAVPAAFGFVGPGTEEVTSEQYSRFLKGLRSYRLVENSKLEFFEVHIATDIQHANFFWQALDQVALTERDWLDVSEGAKHSLSRETKFWNEMMGTK